MRRRKSTTRSTITIKTIRPTMTPTTTAVVRAESAVCRERESFMKDKSQQCLMDSMHTDEALAESASSSTNSVVDKGGVLAFVVVAGESVVEKDALVT